jgi:hypothetical protein
MESSGWIALIAVIIAAVSLIATIVEVIARRADVCSRAKGLDLNSRRGAGP